LSHWVNLAAPVRLTAARVHLEVKIALKDVQRNERARSTIRLALFRSAIRADAPDILHQRIHFSD
jgi:hypothetical protein